jgi:DNA-binding Xre family transcriptional regulator
MPIRWKLHEVMARKRMRNKDLAEFLDITENSVYRLRKADDMPRLTPQRLEGICAALRCQPGELLEWVPGDLPMQGSVLSQDARSATAEFATQNSVIVQHSQQDMRNVPKVTLQRLTQYYQAILALSWQGYVEYGLGAVVFTDLDGGPKLAFIERQNLTDRTCLEAIDQNDPEASAVLLYYKDQDYSSPDYTLLTLTGPKSPPECFALSFKS